MTHIDIPARLVRVSIDESVVDARTEEPDEPEGTAPPIAVNVRVDGDGLLMQFEVPMSLTLARVMLSKRRETAPTP